MKQIIGRIYGGTYYGIPYLAVKLYSRTAVTVCNTILAVVVVAVVTIVVI